MPKPSFSVQKPLLAVRKAILRSLSEFKTYMPMGQHRQSCTFLENTDETGNSCVFLRDASLRTLPISWWTHPTDPKIVAIVRRLIGRLWLGILPTKRFFRLLDFKWKKNLYIFVLVNCSNSNCSSSRCHQFFCNKLCFIQKAICGWKFKKMKKWLTAFPTLMSS